VGGWVRDADFWHAFPLPYYDSTSKEEAES